MSKDPLIGVKVRSGILGRKILLVRCFVEAWLFLALSDKLGATRTDRAGHGFADGQGSAARDYKERRRWGQVLLATRPIGRTVGFRD